APLCFAVLAMMLGASVEAQPKPSKENQAMYIEASAANPDRIVIRAEQAALDDLVYRLRNTRWPDEYANETCAYGTNRAYLQELVRYWAEDFDWRAEEQWLNSFDHDKTTIDGLGIHYIHQRSTDPNATPVLLLHGWPVSFVQMLKLVPL